MPVTLRLTSDVDSPAAQSSRGCTGMADAVCVLHALLNRLVAESQPL